MTGGRRLPGHDGRCIPRCSSTGYRVGGMTREKTRRPEAQDVFNMLAVFEMIIPYLFAKQHASHLLHQTC